MRVINSLKRILLLTCCVCLGLSVVLFAGCKDDETVKFVDFEDITITVPYGANMSMLQYVTAVDEDGVAYRCDLTVKDSEGKEVEVIFDRFNVTSILGYTAITTVKDFDVSRTITIKVEDRAKIFIEDYEDKLTPGRVNKEYLLPSIEVSKPAEKVEPKFSLYLKDGNELKPVTVTDGKFIPLEVGVYVYKVSATDSLGNTAEKSAEFIIRSSMQDNMLENFGDKFSASSIKESAYLYNPTTGCDYGDGFYTKWHETFDGRNGVVESALNTNFDVRRICASLGQTKEELETLVNSMSEEDFISIWIWLDKDGTYNVYTKTESNEWQTLNKIAGKKWQEVKLYRKNLETFAKENCYGSNSENDSLLFFSAKLSNTSIRFEEGVSVKYYLDSISLIKTSFSHDNQPELGQEFTIPEMSFIGVYGGVADIDFTVSCKMAYTDNTINLTNGKVIFNKAGKYDVVYKTKLDGVDYEYTKHYYVDDGIALGEEYVQDFNKNSSADNIVVSNNMNSYSPTPFYVKWHETFQGKSGVVETVTNDSTNIRRVCGLNSKLVSMADKMDDNDYVSMWVYIDSVNSYQFVLNSLWGDNIGLPHVQGGSWQEIKLSKAILSDTKASGEMLMCFFNNANGNDKAQLKVYIDEIKLVINNTPLEVIEDFSSSDSTAKIVASTNMNSYTTTPFYVTWHESFEGKSGVVETITNDGSTQRRVCGMNAELRAMVDKMDDNDYVSMWVYIDSSNKYQFVLNGRWGSNYSMPYVQGGSWQEIKLYKNIISDSTSGEMLMCFHNDFNGNDKEQLKVYIDDIRLVKVDG